MHVHMHRRLVGTMQEGHSRWPSEGHGQSACAVFGLRSRGIIAFSTPGQPGRLLLLQHQEHRLIRVMRLPTPPDDLGGKAVNIVALAAAPDGRLLAAATTAGVFLTAQHATSEPVRLTTTAAVSVAFAANGCRLLASCGPATECWDVSQAAASAKLLSPDN